MSDIGTWLEGIGLSELASAFEDADVGLDVLPELTEADLRDDLGLSLGQRKRVMRAIRAQFGAPAAEAPPPRPLSAGPHGAETMRLAERRQITILFCDLVGSTRISQSLDVEDYAATLGSYQRNCAEIISRFGGHVAQFLGDGVLAYFGYPLAHEDDCERALIAASELVAEIGRIDDGLGSTMRVRVGIDTGMVVVGDLSLSPEGDIDSVAGETPNRAARLQTFAEPGQIVIGDQTRQILGAFCEFEDMGLQSLKGFSEMVRAWRINPADLRFRGQRNRRRSSAVPLVGRQQESALVVERWQQCRKGESEVLLLIGEAGIGKSRLLAHLMDIVPDEAWHGLVFYCSSYNRDTAFGPVSEQLRRAAGMRSRESAAEQLARLEQMVETWPGDPAETLALLAPLCGLALDPSRMPARFRDLAPEQRKAETMRLLTASIVARAESQPILMIGEDMQWADPSTLELIDRVMDASEHLPVMFALTHRPEFRRGWEERPNATVLRLNRFASTHALDLVRAVTNGLSLPGDLEAEILEKTDGVPLFIEEVTRSLLESGTLRQVGGKLERTAEAGEIDIPATLHEALLTRLDRMNAVKEIALWAAALGRRFSLDLLQRVGPFSREELFSALEKLTASDILRRGGQPPNEFYEFRHALVREAAYNSMLTEKRRALHRDIVAALLEHDPNLMQSDPDLLEQHYQRAGERAKAAEAAIAGGDRIARNYAGPEARRRYLAALDLVESLGPDPAHNRLRLRVALKLASTSITGEQIAEDLERLERAAALAREIGHLPRLGQALYWIGRLNYVSGRLDKAIDFASQSAAIGQETGDARLRAGPDNLLARILCLRGEAVRANEFSARNREDFRELGNTLDEASITGVHSFALSSMGAFEEADSVSRIAVEMAEELGHQPTIAANAMFRAVALGWSGRIEEGGAWVERALDVADSCGDIFRRYVTLGWWGESLLRAAERRGDADFLARARERFADCFEISGRIGVNFHLSAYLAFDGLAALLSGDAEMAEERVGKAVELGRDADQTWGLSIAWQVSGRIVARTGAGDMAEAVETVRRAADIQEGRGLAPEQMRTRLVLADLLARTGAEEEAAAEAARAAELAHACGFDRDGLAVMTRAIRG